MRLGVSAALVDGGSSRRRGIDGSAIVAVGLSGSGSGIAAPGFVDLQVNGFAGVDLMATDFEGYVRVGEALLATGTTAFQPTFVTAPEDVLMDALRAMPAEGIGARVLGAHLEGPVPVAAPGGVHDPSHLLGAGSGAAAAAARRRPVSQVTLAPELPGSFELVDELVARGVTVSAGHTDATAAEAHLAFDRGVAHRHAPLQRDAAVHAARPEHRARRARAHGRVVQMIVDLHHVAPDTVLVAWNAAAGALRAGHGRGARGGHGGRGVRARRPPHRGRGRRGRAAPRASWRAAR